jgi:hypothetical protein
VFGVHGDATVSCGGGDEEGCSVTFGRQARESGGGVRGVGELGLMGQPRGGILRREGAGGDRPSHLETIMW